MDPGVNYGILSLAPAFVALVLAFITREAVFSLLVGCMVGVLITGQNLILGFSGLAQKSLGNADFVWVLMIEVFVGIMTAFFQKSGAIEAFTKYFSKQAINARKAQILAWLLGIFAFFSDYFSPLFVGTVMKGITDKARVSREKLAYICDSTASPVCTIIPFSSWGVYTTGLLVGIGTFTDKNIATKAVISMIPFNFYGIAAVLMVGLIALGIIPEYGPMKAAERRTAETGKVIGDNAKPLLGRELSDIKPKEGIKPNMFLNFLAPVLIIITITLGTYLTMGSAKTLEGFITAVFFQFVVMYFQKMGTIVELMETAVNGVKGVTSAILILALAYMINGISKDLGTAKYVISVTQAWITPVLLLVLTFLICAFISFFTGTSWGTYAIMMPIAVPLAFQLTGGAATSLVFGTIAAVVGGGCFGDHCSPLSDTTILSSLAAGSDHIDHTKTQIPYAFTAAAVSAILYVIMGIII
jgi:Na+/H+ antiporter NhaC